MTQQAWDLSSLLLGGSISLFATRESELRDRHGPVELLDARLPNRRPPAALRIDARRCPLAATGRLGAARC